MPILGELRYDQYGLVWIFTLEDNWEKMIVIKEGRQVSRTDLGYSIVFPFASEDDPTIGRIEEVISIPKAMVI